MRKKWEKVKTHLVIAIFYFVAGAYMTMDLSEKVFMPMRIEQEIMDYLTVCLENRCPDDDGLAYSKYARADLDALIKREAFRD